MISVKFAAKLKQMLKIKYKLKRRYVGFLIKIKKTVFVSGI